MICRVAWEPSRAPGGSSKSFAADPVDKEQLDPGDAVILGSSLTDRKYFPPVSAQCY